MAAPYERFKRIEARYCAGKSDLVGLIKSSDQLEATEEARNKLIVVKINNVAQRVLV